MTASIADVSDAVTDALATGLIDAQKPDGSWDGSDDLRVTDPLCHRPWEAPAGRRYHDVKALITTAISLRALVRSPVARAEQFNRRCVAAS
jgi:hypothetical protein